MRAEFLKGVDPGMLGRPVPDAANGRIRHALGLGELLEFAPSRVLQALDKVFHLHAPSMPVFRHGCKNNMPESLHYPTNGKQGHPSDVSDAKANAAANLKRIREALGYSVKALAAKASVSRATIDSIEGSRSAVGLDKLEAVAGALGLKAWELLQPPKSPAQKAVPRTPGPKAARKPTGVAAELSRSLTEVSRSYRGATAKAPHEMSIRSTSTDRDSPRPKSRQKVAQTVKARTKP